MGIERGANSFERRSVYFFLVPEVLSKCCEEIKFGESRPSCVIPAEEEVQPALTAVRGEKS